MAADAGNAAGGGELRYAGFWARVAALIVDNAVVTLFCLVLIAGASFAGDAAVLVAMAVCLLFALLYWPLLECSVRQATFGKQLLGIQVTELEGGRLSFARSLLRNLAKIVSSLLFFTGFLLAGLTARKQALHDVIVGCLVVRLGPPDLFKAAAASVAGLMIILGGWYYFVVSAYMPQAIDHLAKTMRGTGAMLQKGLDKAMQGAPPPAQEAKPAAPVAPSAAAPVPGSAPPVVAVTPEVPPVAAPAPAAASKPAVAPASKEAAPAPPAIESAPAKPAAAPAKAPAIVAKPAPKEAAPAPGAMASAPAQPAAAPATPAKTPAIEVKPAPKEAVPAPAAMASAPAKPAAVLAAPAKAPAAGDKPAPARPAAASKAAASPVKPVAPVAKPKPAPAPSAELVSEPPSDKPRPARRTTVTVPAAESAAPVSAAPPRPVVTPKYNDVMTAVMYRDAAGVTQLLDLGWWVDRTDSNGVSPLMAAAWIGDLALVQLLLQRGANPNLRARGGSVLEFAGRSEDVIVLDMLKQAGAR